MSFKEKIRSFWDSIRHFDVKKIKTSFIETLGSLQCNYKTLVGTVILSIVLMFAVCWIVFFATVRGSEQIMVPDITGKQLTAALLELQAKELYPKIQLKYTDNPGDEGTILGQEPEGGAIVKAGRRISLTVSRGVIMDHVENYVGQNFDDVKINLQTMFTGSAHPLIALSEPVYKPDQSVAGTILSQDPPEGTAISGPITIKLIVSRGPEYDNTRVPSVVGLTFEKLLHVMETSRVVFDFTVDTSSGSDIKEGVVVSQEENVSSFVPNYSRVKATVALPKKAAADTVYGLFSAVLPDYPYPVAMTLECSKDGEREPLVTIKHTGGSVTIPYSAEKDCELILTVAGKTVSRQFVE